MSKWESFIKQERVAISEGWSDEADFDAWLIGGDGLQMLCDVLDIEIDVDSVEPQKLVGKFAADIFARTLDDKVVIIENQLQKTDHDHLGKILTYAAGLTADTAGCYLVWMSREIRDEHRAAIDWLNSKTDRNNNFFAFEIELFQVNQSFSPNLKLVCQPNDWSKTQKQEIQKAPSQTNLLYEEIWIMLRQFMEDKPSRLTEELRFKDGWRGHYLDKSRHYNKVFILTLWLSRQLQSWSAVFYIEGSFGYNGHEIARFIKHEYGSLLAEKLREFGEVQFVEGGRTHNTAHIKVSLLRPVDDKAVWEECFDWLVNCAETLDKTMKPILEELDLLPFSEEKDEA